METMARRIVLHVGCSKTGTSSLQAGLWRSAEALAAIGVVMPFRTRQADLRRLVTPLGWRAVEGFVGPYDEEALAAVVTAWRTSSADLLLVSNEELAEVGPAQAARIGELARAAGVEIDLVVTLRGWADQLPSEYQQFLKHRMVLDYPTFLEQVSAGTDAGAGGLTEWADRYWRRQDPRRVLASWAGVVEPARTHVVMVPSYSADPDGVFRLFGEAAGFDPAVITRPTRAFNSSLGVVEAEVLRRVNLALGERLEDFMGDYTPAVRLPVLRGVMPSGQSARLPLPPEHVGWVSAHADATIAALGSGGYRIHGDAGILRPRPGVARPVPAVEEAEVAAAAVLAFANLAAYDSDRITRIKAKRTPREAAPIPRRRWWAR
jgi:hypothetical protein